MREGGEGETYPHRERGPETRRDLGEGRPVSCVLCGCVILIVERVWLYGDIKSDKRERRDSYRRR